VLGVEEDGAGGVGWPGHVGPSDGGTPEAALRVEENSTGGRAESSSRAMGGIGQPDDHEKEGEVAAEIFGSLLAYNSNRRVWGLSEGGICSYRWSIVATGIIMPVATVIFLFEVN
jgi:hypothetical protein